MMKLAVLALAFAAAFAAPAPLLHASSPTIIAGQYIVVMKDSVSPAEKTTHLKELSAKFAKLGDSANAIMFVYNAALHGYAAKFTDAMLHEVRANPNISYVEVDQEMKVSQTCSTQQNAVWGIDRVNERQINLDGVFHYHTAAASGIDAYVIDTGILTTHTEFAGGRAIWGINYADSQNTDCNGHGTHVAGTIAGTTYGIAKKATVIAVKVLTCAGSGSNTGVIAGVDWTTTSYNSRKRPSVANMSLGGGRSTALETAVKNSISAGVNYAIAAGNEAQDACNVSPAATPTGITAGATTVDSFGGQEQDLRSDFSNFGPCVAIFAPGELIKSAWIGSNTATLTISGTSMAAPHVAGVVAMYLHENPSANPAAVKQALITRASPGEIDLDCQSTQRTCPNSPNLMLYKSC